MKLYIKSKFTVRWLVLRRSLYNIEEISLKNTGLKFYWDLYYCLDCRIRELNSNLDRISRHKFERVRVRRSSQTRSHKETVQSHFSAICMCGIQQASLHHSTTEKQQRQHHNVAGRLLLSLCLVGVVGVSGACRQSSPPSSHAHPHHHNTHPKRKLSSRKHIACVRIANTHNKRRFQREFSSKE